MTLLAALDFETFYDPKAGYTLKTMPILEYVRDQRFASFGAALHLGSLSRTGPADARWLPHDQLGPVLAALRRTIPHITGLAHNAAFDATVLWEAYGIKFDYWIDTMAMAQALIVPYTGRASLAKVVEHLRLGTKDARILMRTQGRYWHQFNQPEQWAMGKYACEDIEHAVGAYRIMAGEMWPPDMEMIDWTVQSFVDQPFRLDEQALEQELARIQRDKAKLLVDVGLNDRAPLMSAVSFAVLLEGLGVEVEMKEGKSGPIPALARTDSFMKGLAEHEDERVQALVAARLGHKSTIGETRCEVLLRVARTRDRNGEARMGAPIRFHAAHTGRWGGIDHQNYQNFERPDPKTNKGNIRKALVAA
jgi:hypothetical protein